MNGTDTHPVPYIGAVSDLYNNVRHLGYPLARFATGLALMPHGSQKLFGLFGGNPDGIAAFFEKIGLAPGHFWLIVVGCIEFFGGACLALGFLTRLAAGAISIAMFVAAFHVHLGNGYFWTKGGLEYPLLLALLGLAYFIRGGGDLSIDKQIGKEL